MNDYPELNRYGQIIERIFLSKYVEGATAIEFSREEIVSVASDLNIKCGRWKYLRRNGAVSAELVVGEGQRADRRRWWPEVGDAEAGDC